ncbi:hypothetical protein AQS8620_00122 [Aquimixticola soesokkakensis]|uniref:Smr domain-containing protein n=1 Tax=Aquimixticola soesokkakensis TaxID=1519096 RepID=A0A1Y5RCU1_9RHOB|nr:Smr/MutS family protein [Aquimixticola soesokkakensis]SLN11943.1 hypothetical protein AQS8620_00122 [Aquimixticola soesokkakensis]
MTRRRKQLSEEDKELWDAVRRSTKPLHPERAARPVVDHTEFDPKPAKNNVSLPRFTLGEKAQTRVPPHDFAPSISDHLKSAPVQMDRKKHQRMTRGKLSPEARIDLHGMTMDAAHPALTRFILSAHADDKRLVLVITGKGKHRDEPGPIPVRRGVLKNQVPHWLSLAPLRAVVLQVTEAHLKHGGSGAYYVYLRR